MKLRSGRHGRRARRAADPLADPFAALGQEDMDRIPSGKEAAHDAVLPLYEELDGSSVTKRLNASTALANLVISNPHCHEVLVKTGGVKRLVTRIFDPEHRVAVEVSGVLRNLCVAGSPMVCEAIVKADAMSGFVTIATRDRNPNMSDEHAFRIHINILTCMTSLCENVGLAGEKIMNTFDNIGVRLFEFVRLALESPDVPDLVELGSTAGQLLLTLSDDNPTFGSLVLENEAALQMLGEAAELADPPRSLLHLRALCGAILSHMYECMPGVSIDLFSTAYKSIALSLSTDAVSMLPELVEAVNEARSHIEENKGAQNQQQQATDNVNGGANNDNGDSKNETDGNEKQQQNGTSDAFQSIQSIDMAWKGPLEAWRGVVSSVCVALESLANMSGSPVLIQDSSRVEQKGGDEEQAGDVPPEIMFAENLSSEQQSFVEKNMSEEYKILLSATSLLLRHAGNTVSDEILELLCSVFEREQVTIILNCTSIARARAFSCLSNLTHSLPKAMLGSILDAWDSCSSHCGGLWGLVKSIQERKKQPNNNHQLSAYQSISSAHAELEATLGFLLAVLSKRPENIELAKAHISMTSEIARGCSDLSCRSVSVGLLGLLGQVPSLFEFNFVTGFTLITVATQDSDIEVQVDAYDALIDVYSEDNVHIQEINNLKLWEKIATHVPQWLEKVENGRHSLPEETVGRVFGMAENLEAFVEYKKSTM